MKERLEELTVSQFIDLLCGDASVLTEGMKENPSKVAADRALRKIISEYREIADASGMRAYLARMEELVKARIIMQMMAICRELIAHGRHGMVREILDEMEVNAAGMSDARVEAEVMSRIARAKATVSEIEGEADFEPGDAGEVRRRFDGQTAALMTHFRFQIDPDRMKATLYAHLVARYAREMKAMQRTSNVK